MIHAEQKTAEGIATLCDADEADIEPIIDYWYSSTEEYLADMGVDLVRLGKPEQARMRYLRALRNGDPAQSSVLFAIKLEGRFVGFTLLNQYEPQTSGIYTHHQRRSNPNQYGVNVACLEGVSPFDFARVPVMDGVQHPGDNAGEARRAGTLRYERWEA